MIEYVPAADGVATLYIDRELGQEKVGRDKPGCANRNIHLRFWASPDDGENDPGNETDSDQQCER